MKTIIIDDEFNQPVRLKECHMPKVIVIEEPPSAETIIEIEGVKYKKREEEKLSGRASKFALMAAMFSYGMEGASNYERPRPNVDIVEEYKLILQKKSKLSRNDRDWVVSVFKHQYIKVD